jgi:hypothetical protein
MTTAQPPAAPAATAPTTTEPAEAAPIPKFDPLALIIDIAQHLAKIAQGQQAAGPMNPTSPAWGRLYKSIEEHLSLAGISLAAPAGPAAKVNTPYVKQPQRKLGAGATQPGSRTPVK